MVRQRRLFQAFASCFVVVFCFCFAQSISWLASFDTQSHLQDPVHPGGYFSYYQATHLPFSAPCMPEPEPADQSELNADDDECGKVFWNQLLKQKLDVIAEKRLLLRLLFSCENREGVSLFILHHSWKSFLC